MRYERTSVGLTDCGHSDYRPGVTLDPFIGSGTVAHVARKLGRHAVGIDLNESYLELAARRLQQQSLFASEASGV
jgi:DNA modification methylase